MFDVTQKAASVRNTVFFQTRRLQPRFTLKKNQNRDRESSSVECLKRSKMQLQPQLKLTIPWNTD